MKVIVFDGKDNAGKTWTLNKIKNILSPKNNVFCNFPSKELCSTELFLKLTLKENANNYDLKMEFIDLLLQDEEKIISANANKTLWVDRMLFSSLVYQGTQTDWTLEEEIMKKYKKMFKKVGLTGDNFYNFIFINKIKDDENETNVAKKNFDSMGDIIGRKFDNLIEKIRTK